MSDLVKRLRDPDWFEAEGLGDAAADRIEELKTELLNLQRDYAKADERIEELEDGLIEAMGWNWLSDMPTGIIQKMERLLPPNKKP